AVGGAANLAVVLLLALVLIVFGLPTAGAFAYGLTAGGCGLVFAALAAVTAQLSETARGARGAAIAVLGATFLLRGVGDSAGAQGPARAAPLGPLGAGRPGPPLSR